MCLCESTEVGVYTNIRSINDPSTNTSYIMKKSSIFCDWINIIVSFASVINIHCNNTCNIKHSALSGQVSILSRSNTWGQPDSSLDVGDPPFLCTNNVTVPGERYGLSTSIIYNGFIDEPHDYSTEVNFSDLNVSLSFSANNSFSDLTC